MLSFYFSVCAAVGTPKSQAKDQVPGPDQGRKRGPERAAGQAGTRERQAEEDHQEAGVRCDVIKGGKQNGAFQRDPSRRQRKRRRKRLLHADAADVECRQEGDAPEDPVPRVDAAPPSADHRVAVDQLESLIKTRLTVLILSFYNFSRLFFIKS